MGLSLGAVSPGGWSKLSPHPKGCRLPGFMRVVSPLPHPTLTIPGRASITPFHLVFYLGLFSLKAHSCRGAWDHTNRGAWQPGEPLGMSPREEAPVLSLPFPGPAGRRCPLGWGKRQMQTEVYRTSLGNSSVFCDYFEVESSISH